MRAVLSLALLLSVASPQRVLVLPLERTESVSDETARAVSDLLVAQIARRKRYEVLSADDIKRLAALGADKQAAGCDDTSCLAELAGAMSADQVIFGRVSVLGDRTVLNLSLFDAASAKATNRVSRTFDSLDDLEGALPKLVDELMADKRAGSGGDRKGGGGVSPLLVVGGVGLGAGALVAIGSLAIGELVLSQGRSFSLDGYRRAQFAFAGVAAVGVLTAIAGGVATGVAVGTSE